MVSILGDDIAVGKLWFLCWIKLQQIIISFVCYVLNGFVEFEVDIQTIFRYSILTKTFDSAQDYATALGALYIYTDTTVPVSSATTFRYSLQCGFGDDARLGFQVYNPNFQMCNKLADPGIGGIPTFLPLDFNQTINTSIRDAWYFTKTT